MTTFQPEFIPRIIRGWKTQTRRLMKPGERLRMPDQSECPLDNVSVLTPSLRIKWQVGRDYAVQPGRGKPGVLWSPELNVWRLPDEDDQTGNHAGVEWQPLRIRITAIRQQDVRRISSGDSWQEGFGRHGPANVAAFWRVWCAMHDPAMSNTIADAVPFDILPLLQCRFDERYQAWALTFEVVMP